MYSEFPPTTVPETETSPVRTDELTGKAREA